MLVWGTANPEGMVDTYNGYYFRDMDIKEALKKIEGVPVKVEHKGQEVGKVVTGWANNGKLDILMSIDEGMAEGTVMSSLIEAGVCTELSLGYTVEMRASQCGEDIAGKKTIKEVSLVRKGARQKCLIHKWVKTREKTRDSK